MLLQLLFVLTFVSFACCDEFKKPTDYVWVARNETGNCVKITAKKLAEDKSLYEGRWYFVGFSVTEEESKHFSCLIFDSFFDKDGGLHDAFVGPRDGKTIRVIVHSKPVDAKNGIYDFNAKHRGWANMWETLYYVDDKVQVRWYVQCLGEGIEHRQALVGYRSLKYIEEKKELVKELTAEMEAKGGSVEKSFVHHDENCKYPPEYERNPFL